MIDYNLDKVLIVLMQVTKQVTDGPTYHINSKTPNHHLSYAYLFFKRIFSLKKIYISKSYFWRGGGVSQFLIFSDIGGRGVGQFLPLADKGRRGVWTPPFLADVICEQPLVSAQHVEDEGWIHEGSNAIYVQEWNDNVRTLDLPQLLELCRMFHRPSPSCFVAFRSIKRVSKSIQKVSKKVSKKSPKSNPKVIQKYLKGIPKVRTKYPQSIPKVPEKYLKGISKISWKYPKSIKKIPKKYPKNIQKYPKNISLTSVHEM